jgi:hypothetical protein
MQGCGLPRIHLPCTPVDVTRRRAAAATPRGGRHARRRNTSLGYNIGTDARPLRASESTQTSRRPASVSLEEGLAQPEVRFG